MVNCSLSPEPAALLLNDAVWNSATLMNEVLLIAQKRIKHFSRFLLSENAGEKTLFELYNFSLPTLRVTTRSR